MKKLKKFYKNNRIYCILMGISLFCLALIAMLFVVYFVNQTKNDTYGNRLNGIESMEISDSEKDEIVNVIKENDVIYLPLSEMLDVYNIEIENIEDTKIITVDSLDREQIKADTKYFCHKERKMR